MPSSRMLFIECEYVNMMCACVKKKSFVVLQYKHHCGPTYCPYWHANDLSKVRNSQSAIEMQEE